MVYKIVKGEYEENLEKEVNSFLKKGWKLAGGMCMGYKDLNYCQAMTYEKPKRKVKKATK